jgi:transposase
MTIPGVGFILAVVILTETGDLGRFGRSDQPRATRKLLHSSCKDPPSSVLTHRILTST